MILSLLQCSNTQTMNPAGVVRIRASSFPSSFKLLNCIKKPNKNHMNVPWFDFSIYMYHIVIIILYHLRWHRN